jgi:uncharacterized membrane protein YfcA
VIAAMLVGVLAGIVAGMLGVGGGILFVPALTIFVGFSQVHAESTSLLAIVPVAAIGAARQYQHGNVRLKDGALIGVLSAAGAVGGAALSNVLPQRTLELMFAGLVLFMAFQLVRRALAEED